MYQSLPPTYEGAQPLLDRVMQETAQVVLQTVGSPARPDPPRRLISQPGALLALITWNAPQRIGSISGWRIYQNDETNLVLSIQDVNVRQYSPTLPAATPTAFYISAVNPLGVESIKVQVIAVAGAAGTIPPTTPPGYGGEPSGGSDASGGFGRKIFV